MANTKLINAYQYLMEQYQAYIDEDNQKDETEIMDTQEELYGEYLGDPDAYEAAKQADKIEEIIQDCRADLLKEHNMSKEELLCRVVASIGRINQDETSAEKIDISYDNLAMILDVLPEDSKISKECEKEENLIPVGYDALTMWDYGEIYKKSGVGIENLNHALLLDKYFMEGYLKATGTLDLNQDYVDLKMTNQEIIDHVNGICEGLERGER